MKKSVNPKSISQNSMVCVVLLLFVGSPIAAISAPNSCQTLLNSVHAIQNISLTEQFEQAVQSKKLNLEADTIAVVGGYSSANMFAPTFSSAKYQVIHIDPIDISKTTLDFLMPSFHAEDYALDLKSEDPLTGFDRMPEIISLLKRFKSKHLKAVLTGADWSVLYADRLSYEMNKVMPWIRTDGISDARKFKHLQQQKLKEAGIDYIQYTLSSNAQDAINWVNQKGYLSKEPRIVVVKPNNGAGTIGLHLCRSEQEIRDAFNDLLSPDRHGHRETEVLVQEFIPGEVEYSVNFTSLDGHHVVSDMYVNGKRRSGEGGHSMIYSYTKILPFTDPLAAPMIEYGIKVANALGALNGNSHIEVKFVPGRGFVLIEHNDRMIGGRYPELSRIALGRGQADLTLMSVQNPKAFKQLKSEYTQKKFVAYWAIANFQSGRRLKMGIDDMMKKLTAYSGHYWNYKLGDAVPLTLNLADPLGGITFIADTEAELNQGLKQIEDLEKVAAFTE